MNKIAGKVIVLGNDIDTDQILPGYAMAEPYEFLGKYAMAGLSECDFSSLYEKGGIIVAGKNFGCGSSREQAPIALKQLGVSLIIAESFARIFRRNAINIGLPVWKADLRKHVKNGDYIEVYLDDGEIKQNDRVFKFDAMSENTLYTLECGGLISRVRQELGIG